MNYEEVLAAHEMGYGEFYADHRPTFVLKCKHCHHQVSGPHYDTPKAREAARLRAEELVCKNITCPSRETDVRS